MSNIVYVLTNPAMPDIVKIGMTDRDDVQKRMSELYSTGVPLPFECSMALQVEGKKAADIENALHTAFEPYRVNPSREFFNIEPEQAEALLRVISGIDVTPKVLEQDSAVPEEDREAASEYKRSQNLTNEKEFLESLNVYGIRVFERVLALARQRDTAIKWGKKGFSFNVISNGTAIAICYGYPPSSVYKQSIYTDFGTINRKSNLPDEALELIRKEALDIGVFVPVGSNSELASRIIQAFDDNQIDALIGWLSSVAERIREFETVNADSGQS